MGIFNNKSIMPDVSIFSLDLLFNSSNNRIDEFSDEYIVSLQYLPKCFVDSMTRSYL